MGRTPISREGFDKLKAEVDRLETIEMPRIANLIAEARAEGDLSENAEFHAQRENQGMLQAKINVLKDKLAHAYIVDKSDMPKDKIVFGARVTVKDLDADLEEVYEFVGPGEEDYSGEVLKILCESPLAKQLINHKVGDQVEVETPGGKIRYEVVKIG